VHPRIITQSDADLDRDASQALAVAARPRRSRPRTSHEELVTVLLDDLLDGVDAVWRA
jgi:hypothetical protein